MNTVQEKDKKTIENLLQIIYNHQTNNELEIPKNYFEKLNNKEILLFLLKTSNISNLFLDFFIKTIQSINNSNVYLLFQEDPRIEYIMNFYRIFKKNIYVNLKNYLPKVKIINFSQEITNNILKELENNKKEVFQFFKIKTKNENNLEIKDNIKNLEKFLKMNYFTIIEGPEYSGKSHLLKQFIEKLNKKENNILKMVIDKSTEISNLIGNYIISNENENKQFKWKEGPFMKSVKEGKLFIMENFELANDQLKSFILNCMIDNRCVYKNSKIDFHNNFRLIICTRETDFFQNSIFKITLSKKSIDDYLNILLNGVEKNIFFTMFTQISKILYSEFKNFLQIKKLFQRSTFIYEKFLKKQDCTHMSSHLKSLIYLNIIDIFYKGEKETYFTSSLTNKINKTTNSTNDEITTILKSYTIQTNPKNFESSRFLENITKSENSNFIYTNQNSELLEKIIGSVKNNESTLLVGETGTGKTTMIQELARMYNKKLRVYNLSHSTDSSDLFGGYKPINNETFFRIILNDLENFMNSFFDLEKNKAFFGNLKSLFVNKKFLLIAKCVSQACESIVKSLNENDLVIHKIYKLNENVKNYIRNPEIFTKETKFQFLKGMIYKALENGDWVLFDEINLAGEDVLMRLNQLLTEDKIYIVESNKLEIVEKPKDFRIFGCMNPAFEIGKKPLPKRIEKIFTCFNFPPVDSFDEIYEIIEGLLKKFPIVNNEKIKFMASFYLWLRNESKKNEILDNKDKKLVLSLRQLKRSLNIICNCFKNKKVSISVIHTIYIGYRIAFFLDLNKKSKIKFNKKFEELFQIENIAEKYTKKNFFNITSKKTDTEVYIENHPFQIKNSPFEIHETKFIITPTIKTILHDVLKILLFNKKIPILLEGPTSIGKTSLIHNLSQKLKHKIVRVNNHRDTDLDEYIGKFIPGEKGKIIFQKGHLLKAMEEGSWLLLDELNLAKSEILEALNRVFDDNQELYVPELERIIRPQPGFRVFATQNPSSYSGRSLLSKAFKNRFVCINYDEIKREDLSQILNQKCELPMSRVEMMLDVKEKLQFLKSSNDYLGNKDGIITIRDLIKWSNRKDFFLQKEDLAYEGFALLAERVREENQKDLIRKILEKSAKIKIDEISYYNKMFDLKKWNGQLADRICWSDEFRKVFVLLNRGFSVKEPVLLVGETGCGKTTLAQMMSEIYNIPYYYMNCHKNTEVSDFIGNWRPCRDKDVYRKDVLNFLKRKDIYLEINFEIGDVKKILEENDFEEEDKTIILGLLKKLENEFEWVDGKLIKALKHGGIFLIDEISLASDNVLERFNSLLEAERKMFVQESEDGYDNEIVAHEKFFLIATMNPSGDHGKRELSPALRNRFTEIWVTSILDYKNFKNDKSKKEVLNFLKDVLSKKNILKDIEFDFFLGYVFSLFEFFNFESLDLFRPINLRDLETFCTIFDQNNQGLGIGAIKIASEMLFESSLGLIDDESFKNICKLKISEYKKKYPKIFTTKNTEYTLTIDASTKILKINNIYFKIQNQNLKKDYILDETTIKKNLYKIAIGLKSKKPILLEGPPGVGKTSLLQVLAKLLNKKIYKINIFAQTDMLDLLGADAPDPEKPGSFRWCDGILLRALKEGAWIIFDELNLANQTVLEGLNGVLDFRGEVFVPELGRIVKKKEGFRFFGTQNPGSYGKGRKGLPMSFLNRFFRVYLDELPVLAIQSIVREVKNNVFGGLEIFDCFFEFLFVILERDLVDKKVFNIRFMKKVLEYINFFYDGDNFEIVVTSCFYLLVILQNENEDKNFEIIRLFEQNGFLKDFKIGVKNFESDNLVLFNSKEQIMNLKKTKGFLNFFEIFNNSQLLELWLFNTVIELKTPLILKTKGKKNEIINMLDKISVLNNKKLRKLFLYKSADDSDLLGYYDQFNWKYLYKKYLKKIYKQKNYNLFKILKNCEKEEKKLLKILESELKKNFEKDLQKLIKFLKSKKPFFSWIDSQLAKSVEKGDWIILQGCENANPALLEKLNGLLEDDYLVINECFDEINEIRKIKKCEGFRIFFLFDELKKKSKISDPLKNRCVCVNFDSLSKKICFDNYFEKSFCFLRNLNFISKQNIIDQNEIKYFFKNFEENRNYKCLENFIKNYINPFEIHNDFSQDYLLKPDMDSITDNHFCLLFKTIEKVIDQNQNDKILEILKLSEEEILKTDFLNQFIENLTIENKNNFEIEEENSKNGNMNFENENLNENRTNIDSNNLLSLKLIDVICLRIFNINSPNKKVKLLKNDELYSLLLKNDISKKLNFLNDNNKLFLKKIIFSLEILKKEIIFLFEKEKKDIKNIFDLVKFEKNIFLKTKKICSEILKKINSEFLKNFSLSKNLFLEIQDPLTFQREIFFFYDKENINSIYSLISNVEILNSEKEEKLNFLLQEKFEQAFLFFQKYKKLKNIKNIQNMKNTFISSKIENSYDFYAYYQIKEEFEKLFILENTKNFKPNLLELEIIQKFVEENINLKKIKKRESNFKKKNPEILSLIKHKLKTLINSQKKDINPKELKFYTLLEKIFKNDILLLKKKLQQINFGYKIQKNNIFITKEKNHINSNLSEIQNLYTSLPIRSLKLDFEEEKRPLNFVCSEIYKKCREKIKSSLSNFDEICLENLKNIVLGGKKGFKGKNVLNLFFSFFENYEFIFNSDFLGDIFEDFEELVFDFYENHKNIRIFDVYEKFESLRIYEKREKLKINFYLKDTFDNKDVILQIQDEVSKKFEENFKNLIENLKSTQRLEDKSSFTEAGKIIILEENLNKLARYEYNEISVNKNREEKLNELRNKFKNYKEDFDLGIYEKEIMPELKQVSKIEEKFHEKSKEYYFNIITKILISNNFDFTFKKNFSDFIFIIKKNIPDFEINLNTMKNIFKERINLDFKKSSNFFELSNIEISKNKTKQTDPLQKLIEKEIISKIKYSNTYSFYQKNDNLEFLKEIIESVKTLLKKLHDFLSSENFSELKSLIILTKICQKVIELNINTPFSKIATGLNLIISNLLEFNLLLPKKMKLKEDYEIIIKKLIKLRKLEKRLWKKMLVINENEIKNREILEFVYLKNIFFDKKNEFLIFRFVEDYLNNATLGNFSQKIFLLYSLKNKIVDLSDKKIFENILRFYSSKNNFLEENLLDLLKAVDEPMKNIAKLMNWHFEDLVNLKMNVEKLYKGVNRSLKKQKEILTMNFKGIIINGQRNKILFNEISTFVKNCNEIINKKKEDIKEKIVKKQFIDDLIEKRDILKKEDISYYRIISLEDLCEILEINNILKKKQILIFSKEIQFGKNLIDFMDQYLIRMDSLKDQKINFKLRALNDFLKDINIFDVRQRINLEKNFTYRIIFQDLEIPVYEENLEKIFGRKSLVSKNIIEKIRKMNLRIFSVLEYLKKMKEETLYHENIPKIAHEKMIASFFSFYLKYLEHSKVFKKIIDDCVNINDSLNNFEEKDLKIKEINFFLNYFIDLSNYDENLKRDKNSLLNLKEKIIRNSFENLVYYKFQNPELEKINNLIKDLKEVLQSQKDKSTSQENPEFYKNLKRTFKKKMYKIENSEKTNIISLQLDFLTSIHSHTSQLSKNPSKIQSQNPLITLDIKTKLLHSLNWLYSLNKFTYILSITFSNLLYKGFCISKEEMLENEQNKPEQETEMDFGTGVGEGKGNENAHEEIEFEEQILGEKNDEKNEDENEDENEGADEEDREGMEMENDFEGENDKEDEKEKEENEKKKDEDIDDEFDDVDEDDLDPKLFKEEDSEEEEEEEKDNEELKECEKVELEREDNKEESRLKAEEQKEEKRKLDEKEELMKEEEHEGEEEENEEIEEKEDNEEEEMEFQPDDNKDYREEKENDLQEEEIEENEEDLEIDENEKSVSLDGEEEDDKMEEEILGSEIEDDNLELLEENENEDLKQEEENYEIEDYDQNKTEEETKNKNKSKNQKKEDNDEGKDDEKNEELEEKMKEKLEKRLKELMRKDNLDDEDNIEEMLDDVNLEDNVDKDNEEEENNEEDYNMDFEINEKVGKLKTKTHIKINRNEIEEEKKNQKEKEDIKKENNEEEDKKETELNKQKQGEEEAEEEIEDLLKKRESPKKIIEEDILSSKKLKVQRKESSEDLLKILETYKDKNNFKELINQKEILEIFKEAQILINKEVNKLCENLKTILEQKKFSSLKGNYRTGKKLNMKKIVPYIASNYRKDKIWLRRSLPDEKDYRIMISIDDSLSMKEKNVGKLALFSLNVIGMAIYKSQVGTLDISKIRDGLEIVGENSDWSLREKEKIFSSFNFDYEDDFSADLAMSNFIKETRGYFLEKGDDKKNICFIISDGRMNKGNVKKMLIGAEEENCLFFMVILDNENYEDSIVNYKTTEIVQENGKVEVVIKNYMEDFPFDFYVVIRDINNLSEVVVKILIEYFERYD